MKSTFRLSVLAIVFSLLHTTASADDSQVELGASSSNLQQLLDNFGPELFSKERVIADNKMILGDVPQDVDSELENIKLAKQPKDAAAE